MYFYKVMRNEKNGQLLDTMNMFDLFEKKKREKKPLVFESLDSWSIVVKKALSNMIH
jgi:hypothetical protein